MQNSDHYEIDDILASIPLFAGIPSKHLDSIARSVRRVEFAKGEHIFRMGEPAHEMFFLVSGQVKRATFSVGGNEKVLELLPPGQTFAEADLFGGRTHASFAVAVEPTVLLCIGGDSLRRTLKTEPQLALRLIGALARRAVAVESDATASHFRNGWQRVFDYLLEQAGPDISPDGQTTLMLATSKQLIASCLGMTPETLSRILRDLSDAGLIIVAGRIIHLQNARIADCRAAASTGQGVFRHRDHVPPAARRRGMPRRDDGATPSLCTAINMAGRQRMLSQRMAKFWLLLGRRIQPARSRTVLAESTRLFESQLAALARLPVSDGVRDAQVRVRNDWRSYRSLLASEATPARAHALFDLNESLLAATDAMTLAYEQAAGTMQGRLVNLAGRQRMLSQRIPKFYLFQYWGIHAATSRAGLEEAMREFAAAQETLAAAARGVPRIEAQLERVSLHWQTLQTALTASSTGADKRNAGLVSVISERLLRQMDTAVALYEDLPG